MDLREKAKFANNFLVFMIIGLFTKWKRPVCLIFCEGRTPTANLVCPNKTVIRQLSSYGLNLIAMVCNQGTANRVAINTLLNDIKRYCFQHNTEHRFAGFLVDRVEVVHF